MAPPRGPPGSAIGSVGSGRERSAEPTRSRQAPRAPLPVVSGREAAASAPRLRGCRTRSSHACSRSVWLNHRNYLLESPHRFSVADLHQVCRVQDRLPPELPGRGEEGLPPLCPPAQVPGTERSHLIPTSRPHPRGQGVSANSLGRAVSQCHSCVPLAGRPSDVTRAQASQRKPRMPDDAPGPPCYPLLWGREGWVPHDVLSGGRQGPVPNQALVTTVMAPPLGGNTVEMRLGSIFNYMFLIKRSSFLRWVFLLHIATENIFLFLTLHKSPMKSRHSYPEQMHRSHSGLAGQTGRPVLPTPQPHLLWALSHNPCPPEPREGSEPRQGLASGTVTARPCTVER
nr:uncharacterized protein LOC105883561 isoform X1 [Microcebus murinus]